MPLSILTPPTYLIPSCYVSNSRDSELDAASPFSLASVVSVAQVTKVDARRTRPSDVIVIAFANGFKISKRSLFL